MYPGNNMYMYIICCLINCSLRKTCILAILCCATVEESFASWPPCLPNVFAWRVIPIAEEVNFSWRFTRGAYLLEVVCRTGSCSLWYVKISVLTGLEHEYLRTYNFVVCALAYSDVSQQNACNAGLLFSCSRFSLMNCGICSIYSTIHILVYEYQ